MQLLLSNYTEAFVATSSFVQLSSVEDSCHSPRVPCTGCPICIHFPVLQKTARPVFAHKHNTEQVIGRSQARKGSRKHQTTLPQFTLSHNQQGPLNHLRMIVIMFRSLYSDCCLIISGTTICSRSDVDDVSSCSHQADQETNHSDNGIPDMQVCRWTAQVRLLDPATEKKVMGDATSVLPLIQQMCHQLNMDERPALVQTWVVLAADVKKHQALYI